jgi:hypothetical protein
MTDMRLAVVPDKEKDLVNEILKVLDSCVEDPNEIFTALINTVGFVILTAIAKEKQPEVLFLFVADLSKAINFLADQLGLEFDWARFMELKKNCGQTPPDSI